QYVHGVPPLRVVPNRVEVRRQVAGEGLGRLGREAGAHQEQNRSHDERPRGDVQVVRHCRLIAGGYGTSATPGAGPWTSRAMSSACSTESAGSKPTWRTTSGDSAPATMTPPPGRSRFNGYSAITGC